MSNVLCPIVARYSLFFTLALFDSSILARSKYPREVALSMVQHAQEQSQAHRHAKTAAATKVTILNQPKDRDKTLFSAFFFWFFLFSVPLSFSLYSLLSLSLSRVFALQIILWFFSALTRNLVWNKERNRAIKSIDQERLDSLVIFYLFLLFLLLLFLLLLFLFDFSILFCLDRAVIISAE
ncbi:MAG: hypothetical protein JOS17DRAFT_730506 [Linnemannia elongata]|nr:MAG: hypothetical protein JOS17DRAFT_730506 [Linnemannia elongata]